MQLTLMTIISKLAKLIINDLFTEIIKFLNLDLSSKYMMMSVIDGQYYMYFNCTVSIFIS